MRVIAKLHRISKVFAETSRYLDSNFLIIVTTIRIRVTVRSLITENIALAIFRIIFYAWRIFCTFAPFNFSQTRQHPWSNDEYLHSVDNYRCRWSRYFWITLEVLEDHKSSHSTLAIEETCTAEQIYHLLTKRHNSESKASDTLEQSAESTKTDFKPTFLPSYIT